MTEIDYFDAEGEPVNVSGRARVVREYDDRHNMTYEAIFDTDLNPTLNGEGYSARKLAYDDNGLVSRVDYLGTDGEKVLLSMGYAAYEIKYDENGNLTLRAYYDEKGEPTAPPSMGYARFERSLDRQSNVLEEVYYAADGSLVVNRDGYAVITCRIPRWRRRTFECAMGVLKDRAYDERRFDYLNVCESAVSQPA